MLLVHDNDVEGNEEDEDKDDNASDCGRDGKNHFYIIVGITHAAVWAACCSFISHNTDAELRPSAQGVLQVTCLQWRASPCPLECLLPCSNVFDC